MLDAINLIDIEDKTVKKDSRLSSNQIKTRQSSFKSISGYWRKFRISLLSKKLDKMKDELVTEKYKVDSSKRLTEKSEEKIIKKTNAIANLEERIKILSREDVPSNYVRNRAIKLRKSMIENLVANSRSAYSVGLDNYDKVFSDEVVSNVNSFDPGVAMAAAAGNTAVAVDAEPDIKTFGEESMFINRGDIKSAIEAGFDKIKAEAVEEQAEVKQISPETVENVVTGRSMFDDPEETVTDEVVSSGMFDDPEEVATSEVVSSGMFDDPEEVATNEVVSSGMFDDPEDIATTNEIVSSGMFDAPEETATSEVVSSGMFDAPEENINRSQITEEIDNKFNEMKVTKNEATTARVERYDGNGLPKYRRPAIVDITDEELAKARENIEFDKYEKKYAEEWEKKLSSVAINKPSEGVASVVLPQAKVETAEREDIVVVPDRDEEKDLHFDYSDATEKDIVAATKVERSASGLEALKARALALKEKNKQSKQLLDEARRAQNEEAQRALEIKNAAQAKEKEYQDSLSKLNDYCEALEEDTEINMNLAAVAKTDTECNRRFIREKQAEIEDYDSKMDEIDSYISPEAINVRPRR